ncbi:hypothetical protein F2P81_026008 [Scophthalmus maximus]|uniref:BED-type domain-containing protein n=1 Tax=Scophthalmus maximus TaxID=52904 RepID=A0A6A4RNA5_SCOMX|nr:hypothetical protein F2P81_026008 [Scophthalmus maximus]
MTTKEKNVWEHFRLNTNRKENKVTCSRCNTALASTSMLQHLHRRHRELSGGHDTSKSSVSDGQIYLHSAIM